jgi:hypothetical protein
MESITKDVYRVLSNSSEPAGPAPMIMAVFCFTEAPYQSLISYQINVTERIFNSQICQVNE